MYFFLYLVLLGSGIVDTCTCSFWAMFPLSCARVHAHTGSETSAHKKTWSAHKCSLKKVFAHILYTQFQIQTSSGKMLPKKLYAHTDLKKLQGALLLGFQF